MISTLKPDNQLYILPYTVYGSPLKPSAAATLSIIAEACPDRKPQFVQYSIVKSTIDSPFQIFFGKMLRYLVFKTLISVNVYRAVSERLLSHYTLISKEHHKTLCKNNYAILATLKHVLLDMSATHLHEDSDNVPFLLDILEYVNPSEIHNPTKTYTHTLINQTYMFKLLLDFYDETRYRKLDQDKIKEFYVYLSKYPVSDK